MQIGSPTGTKSQTKSGIRTRIKYSVPKGKRRRMGDTISAKCEKLVLEQKIQLGGVPTVLGVQENQGQGSCLFYSLEQCWLTVEENGQEVAEDSVKFRRRVTEFASREENWAKWKDMLLFQHMADIPAFQKDGASDEVLREAYFKYMINKKSWGTMEELSIASRLYKFNFTILNQEANSVPPTRKSTKAKPPVTYYVSNYELELDDKDETATLPWFYFRFSGDIDRGHWERLFPISLSSGSRSIPAGIYIEVPSESKSQMTRFSKYEPSVGTSVAGSEGSGGVVIDAVVKPTSPASPREKRKRCDSPERMRPWKKIRVDSQRKRKRETSLSPDRKTKRGRNSSAGVLSSFRNKSCEKALDCSQRQEISGRTNSDSFISRVKLPFLEKRVLITTSGETSRGVTSRVVQKYYAAGASIFLITSKDDVENFENEFAGLKAFHVPLDGSFWDATQKIVREVFPLDCVVNCAGISVPVPNPASMQEFEAFKKEISKTFDPRVIWMFCLVEVISKCVEDNDEYPVRIVNLVSAMKDFPMGSNFASSQNVLSFLTDSIRLDVKIDDNVEVVNVKSFTQ